MTLAIMWIFAALSFAGTAAALGFLPDTVPVHYDIAGSVDRFGSKYELLVAPAILLCVSLALTLLSSRFEKTAAAQDGQKSGAAAKTNAKVIRAVGLFTALFVCAVQGFLIHGAFNQAAAGTEARIPEASKMIFVLVGLLFVAIGNLMTKTRPNSVVGFRTKWSMYNDNTWKKSNRFGGIALMVCGALIVVAALLCKDFLPVSFLMIGLCAISAISTLIYARKVYLQEARAQADESAKEAQ